MGMSCLDAENGLAALKLLKEAVVLGQPFDRLILDQHVLDMDGLELVRQVKTAPDLSSIQLVMLTSMGRRGDAADAQEARRPLSRNLFIMIDCGNVCR